MATQYIVPAFPFPIYVNDDGLGNQFILPGVYLNEVPGGGTVYTGSWSDSAATSDGFSGAAIMPASLADSAATSDSFTGNTLMLGAWADSAAATDAFSGAAIFAGAFADTAAVSDSFTGSALMLGALSDSAATSDTFSGTAVMSGSFSDSAAATDAWIATAIFAGAWSDTAATADGFTGSSVMFGALADAAAYSDIFTGSMGGMVYYGSWSDTAVASDSFTGSAVFAGSLSDIAAYADGFAWYPVFPRTAGDIIVCNSTVGGFGATDVTSQTFQYSIVNTFDPQRVFSYGAIFAFEAGLPMENAPNPLCILFFTRPDGTKFNVQTPDVYIGRANLPTYLGVLAASTYVIYIFPPKVLVRGCWRAQLSFQPTPQRIPVLSAVGTFTIPATG